MGKFIYPISFSFFMNKRGQWNIGVGVALILGGLFFMNKGGNEEVIIGIVLVGAGMYLTFR